MRNWKLQAITQIVKCLTLTLPEAYQSDIIELKNVLAANGNDELEIQIDILKTIFTECYPALIEIAPIKLSSLWEQLSPDHAIKDVYGILSNSPQILEDIKEEFDKDYFESNQMSMQISGIVLIFFFLILGILDIWCLPETKTIALSIKILVLSILFITTFLSFRPQIFRRYNQQILGISICAAGLGVIFTMNLSRINEFGHNTYYGALMVIVFYLYLISGLRFFNTIRVSIIFMLEYCVINNLSQPSIVDQFQYLRYFNDSFFLFTSLIIGIIASNIIERSVVLNFLIRYTIANRLREFLHYFEHDNPTKFLKNINEIRCSPKILSDFLSKTISISQNQSFLTEDNIERSQILPVSDFIKIPVSQSISKVKTKEQKGNASVNSLLKILNLLYDFFKSYNLKINHFLYELNQVKKIEEIEILFWNDYFQGSLFSIRTAIFFSIVVYALFGFLDIFSLPETKLISIQVRVVYCAIATVILCTSLFFGEYFQEIHQVMITAMAFAGGMGVILMIAFSKPLEMGYATYYSGLIQILFFIFAFSRLRFLKAILVSIFHVLSYLAICIYYQNAFSSPDTIALLITNFLFLTISCLVGAIACHQFENNSRLEFWTRYAIAHKSQELLCYYEHTKPSPKQLLDMINGIRHSPKKLQEFLIEIIKYH